MSRDNKNKSASYISSAEQEFGLPDKRKQPVSAKFRICIHPKGKKKKYLLFNNPIFSNYFYSCNLPMLIIDPISPGTILEVNKTTSDLLKIQTKNLQGKKIREISPLQQNRIDDYIASLLKGNNNAFEYKILDNNRKAINVLIHSCKIKFDDKEYLHFTLEDHTYITTIERQLKLLQNRFGKILEERTQELAEINIQLHKDIEKRVEIEHTLKQSEDRFAKAIEVSSDGFWDWDGITGIVYRSKGWYDMLNYNHEQFEETVETWHSLIHPDDLETVNKKFQAHQEGKTPFYECEYRMKTSTGDYKWIYDRGKVFERNPKGEVVRMLGAHKDITLEKMAKEALIESKEKFRALIENSNDMVIRFDKMGNLLYMNPQAYNLLEKTEQRKQLSLQECIPQQLHQNLKTLITQIFSSKESCRKIITSELRDGNYTFDWQINPEYNLQKEVQSVIASGRDITQLKKAENELKRYRLHLENLVDERTLELTKEIDERKKIEKELIRAKQKAEASDQLKSAFMDNLSHEVRTPMNAILGFAALLGTPELATPKRDSFIKYINTNAQGLMDLINDMLNLSKIEADELRIEYTTFDGIAFIQNQKKLVTQKLQDFKKQNMVEILIDIPQEIKEFPIRTDQYRLGQVFSKLWSNAIKFTEEGHIRLGFRKTDGKMLHFFVEDSGIGIHPNDAPNIFKRFAKIDTPHDKLYRGMGMGLTIAQKLVQLLGGEIFIESIPGKGSIFYFEIPCQLNLQNQNFDNQKNNTMKIPKYDWSQKTILIAEDVESNYLFLEEVIKKTGATILWATNGEKAIELYKQHKIDLILMDIQMPVMNGFDATRIIKELDSSIPIISQTAYAMAEDRDKSLEAGCDDYISKPIPTIKLLDLLSNYINVKVTE